LADDVSLTEAERTRGRAFAAKLSMRVLARTWQMLLKGIEEVAAAGRPLAAAEMVLVRIAYAADLPTPDEVIRSLGEGARGNGSAQIPPGQPAARADMPARAETSRAEIPRGSTRAALAELPRDAPVARGEELSVTALALQSFEDLLALAADKRDLAMKSALERDVRLVRFEEGSIEFALSPGASPQLAQQLMRRLQEWTSRRWMVAISSEAGAPSLSEQAEAAAAAALVGVRADPLVQRALAVFPGAEIVGVRSNEAEAAEKPAAEDIGYADTEFNEDDL
jgi:DNA polymerase-3 subunit gamma/tau